MPSPISPSASRAPTLKVSLRPSTSASTAVAVISAPSPDGLMCVTFISEPTVVAPSGSSAGNGRHGGVLHQRHHRGGGENRKVARTHRGGRVAGGDGCGAAAESPFSSIIFAVRNSFIAVNRYLCRRHPGKPRMQNRTGFHPDSAAKVQKIRRR